MEAEGGGTGSLLTPSSSPDILGFAPLLNAAAEILPPPVELVVRCPAPENILALVGDVGVMGAGESRPVGTGMGAGGGMADEEGNSVLLDGGMT